MSLVIFLLGSLQMTLDEAPLAGFSTDKERALLLYLALERQHAHRRESLAALFWEEQPQQLAFNNLRKTLHRLRQTLQENGRPQPCLLITAKEVQWNPAADIRLDVEEFVKLINRSHNHQHRRAATCQSCRAGLTRAAALYRGNFLDQFWLADSAAFEEWTARWRERLRSQALNLFGQLADFTEKEGQTAEAMAYARQLAALEPWQESAHRAIMRLLVQNGRRTAALAQYEQLRQTLAQELDVTPEPETVYLYQQIRDGRFYATPPIPPPGFLPPSPTPLIGREQEQLALQEQLHRPDIRLVTIVGPGGIGKTRLALSVGANVRADFPGGVWFVDLTSLADDEEKAIEGEARFVSRLVMVIAAAIGLSLRGLDPPEVQLLSALKNMECLLLLDNFETAMAGVGLIQEILLASTGVVILATSRERLRFQAELVFRLAGLETPSTNILQDDYLAYESVILFNTGAARTGQPLTAESLPLVGEICRFLEGIPLGIELAASWTPRLKLAEILNTLQSQYEHLEARHRDIPERHRTMAAVFEGSWRLLTPDQQTALAQASIFRGGFTREAASEIISSPWSDIVELVDKSLLRLEANGRYTLHELLRQFSAVKLSQEGGQPAINRHSHFYLTFIAQRTAAFWQQSPQKPLAEIQPEFENIHAAWQAALDERNFDVMAQSLAGLTTFYVRSGLFHEGIEILTETITAIEADDAGKNQSLRGWLQVELARLAAPVAQFETARASAEKALSLAEATGDRVLQSWSQFRLARTLWMQGHYAACDSLLNAALATAQAVNIERLEAECWLALSALADTHGGNFPLARERGQKALALFNQSRNPLGELRMFILLGNFSWGTGDYSLAQGFYEQALHLSRQVNSRQDEAAALANLGTVLREQGVFEQALDYYQPALRLFGDLQDRRRGFVTRNNLSLLYHHMNQQHLALDYGQQALTAVQELDTRSGESQPLCCIGHALLALDRPEEAAAAYKKSSALHQEAGNYHLAMDPIAGLVRTALAQDNHPEALFYTEAILEYLSQGSLNGTAEPIRIQLTVWQALTAVHDPRAKNVLESAYQSLITRANKISNPLHKQSFLQNIPAHLEIQSAASALNQVS